jgi:hypothetical protein
MLVHRVAHEAELLSRSPAANAEKQMQAQVQAFAE